MEERALGGELLLRPLEWLKWTNGVPCNDRVTYIVPPTLYKRALQCPQRPMTRFEYLEAMAFAGREERDGSV